MGALRNVEYSFIAIAPGPLRLEVVAPDMIISMSQIKLFDHLNWVQTNDLCVGISLIDGLILMWHIPTEISSAQMQSQFYLSKSIPREVIFLIVKLRRGFSQLLFVYVLFAFNIFLIPYFCVMSSFGPPLDHNIMLNLFFVKRSVWSCVYNHKYLIYMYKDDLTLNNIK